MKSFKMENFDKAYGLKRAVIWTAIAYVVAYLLGGDNTSLGTLVRGLAGFGLLITTIILIRTGWRFLFKKDEPTEDARPAKEHDKRN